MRESTSARCGSSFPRASRCACAPRRGWARSTSSASASTAPASRSASTRPASACSCSTPTWGSAASGSCGPCHERRGGGQVRAEQRRSSARRRVRGDRADARRGRDARAPRVRRARPGGRRGRRPLPRALGACEGGTGPADGGPRSRRGLVLAAAGAVLLLPGGDAPTTVVAPGAVVGALLLIAGPVLWRLALDRDAERGARVRSEERAEVASRVHDSVLQTLALIQRHAAEPQRVAALARRQERDLRGWLYGDRPLGDDGGSLEAALSAAAADIEELHGVRIELASTGDCTVDAAVRAVVLAAREAMANAAKFAQVDVIDVYAETTDDEVAVFVRDRGAGFDRSTVPADRRGLLESIERRLERAGGRAMVVSAPGEGTEVELRIPRSAS